MRNCEKDKKKESKKKFKEKVKEEFKKEFKVKPNVRFFISILIGSLIAVSIPLFVLVFLTENISKSDSIWIACLSLFLAITYMIKTYFNSIKSVLTNNSNIIDKLNNRKDWIVDNLFMSMYFTEAISIFIYIFLMLFLNTPPSNMRLISKIAFFTAIISFIIAIISFHRLRFNFLYFYYLITLISCLVAISSFLMYSLNKLSFNILIPTISSFVATFSSLILVMIMNYISFKKGFERREEIKQ